MLLWLMVATVDTMTRCLRQLLRKLSATAISTGKHHHAPKKAVFFIKPGEKPLACPQCSTGLHTASDGQLQADLGKQLRFPLHIATTSLLPDMIITSEASRHLIILELTVPWEVLSGLGVKGAAKKKVIQSASEVADKPTRWLWIERADLWTATVGT